MAYPDLKREFSRRPNPTMARYLSDEVVAAVYETEIVLTDLQTSQSIRVGYWPLS
jgi:hypothetical protein